jgi:hypothetical protein
MHPVIAQNAGAAAYRCQLEDFSYMCALAGANYLLLRISLVYRIYLLILL